MLRRILWVALALQAVAIIFMRHPWITTDSQTYLGIAARIDAHYSGLRDLFLVADAVRPPAFPWLLWLFKYGFGWSNAVIVALHMLLYLGSVLLVARVARQYVDERIFLLLCLLFPYAGFYAAVLMTEAWAIAAVALVFLLLHEGRGRYTAAGVGATAAWAALIRSNLIVLPFISAAVALWPRVTAGTRTDRVRFAGMIALVAALVLLPFSLRNGLHYGKWLPLQPAGALGASLFQGVWQRVVPETDREQFFRHHIITERARHTGYAAEMFRLTDQLGVPRFTPLAIEELPRSKRIEADSMLLRAAIERIEQHPAAYLRHVAMNIFDLGNPRSYPAATPRVVEIIMRMVCALIWFAGLLAILVVRRRDVRRALMLSSAMVGGILFAQIWLHTEARYAAPVLLLIVFNAALVADQLLLRRRLQNRSL